MPIDLTTNALATQEVVWLVTAVHSSRLDVRVLEKWSLSQYGGSAWRVLPRAAAQLLGLEDSSRRVHLNCAISFIF